MLKIAQAVGVAYAVADESADHNSEIAPRAFLTPRDSGSSFLGKELRFFSYHFDVVNRPILSSFLWKELAHLGCV